MNSPRIVFAGTPEFAHAALQALHVADMTPVAVYTQPDRRSGRGKKLTKSPVKRLAEQLELPIFQPTSLKPVEHQQQLEALKPDLLVVAAYGLLLPQAVLDIPSIAPLNVHASALPRWRGAAPIQAAILNGDAETGISLMEMTAGLDEGPVYATETLSIAANETAGSLHDRLAQLGGQLLVKQLAGIVRGELRPIPQDPSAVTYAGKITTADARLDWTLPAAALERQVRAYNPVPGCFFELDGERMKCWQATVETACDGPPGRVLSASRDGVLVATGDGALRLTELQRPGKNRVAAEQFCQAIDLSDKTFA